MCSPLLTVRIDFVRKCKQAGLLNEIFEEMLDTLHLAQEKLMNDNTSEAGTVLHLAVLPERAANTSLLMKVPF